MLHMCNKVNLVNFQETYDCYVEHESCYMIEYVAHGEHNGVFSTCANHHAIFNRVSMYLVNVNVNVPWWYREGVKWCHFFTPFSQIRENPLNVSCRAKWGGLGGVTDFDLGGGVKPVFRFKGSNTDLSKHWN